MVGSLTRCLQCPIASVRSVRPTSRSHACCRPGLDLPRLRDSLPDEGRVVLVLLLAGSRGAHRAAPERSHRPGARERRRGLARGPCGRAGRRPRLSDDPDGTWRSSRPLGCSRRRKVDDGCPVAQRRTGAGPLRLPRGRAGTNDRRSTEAPRCQPPRLPADRASECRSGRR